MPTPALRATSCMPRAEPWRACSCTAAWSTRSRLRVASTRLPLMVDVLPDCETGLGRPDRSVDRERVELVTFRRSRARGARGHERRRDAREDKRDAQHDERLLV